MQVRAICVVEHVCMFQGIHVIDSIRSEVPEWISVNKYPRESAHNARQTARTSQKQTHAADTYAW